LARAASSHLRHSTRAEQAFGQLQYPTVLLKISPTTLTRAYGDAGDFAQNVRTIEVLADRETVASGAAATGEPRQYYDPGRG